MEMDAFKLVPENTTRSWPRLPLENEARGGIYAGHFLPTIHRARDEIDEDLRFTIRRFQRGEARWPFTLLGGVGTGKTCAALCILDAVDVSPAIFKTLPDLLMELRSMMARPGIGTENWLWSEWRRAEFTVLDEIGVREKVTDWTYETLKRSIDFRQGRPAMFISNLTLPQLANVFDDRIASRLAEGTVVDLKSADRRMSVARPPKLADARRESA